MQSLQTHKIKSERKQESIQREIKYTSTMQAKLDSKLVARFYIVKNSMFAGQTTLFLDLQATFPILTLNAGLCSQGCRSIPLELDPLEGKVSLGAKLVVDIEKASALRAEDYARQIVTIMVSIKGRLLIETTSASVS